MKTDWSVGRWYRGRFRAVAVYATTWGGTVMGSSKRLAVFHISCTLYFVWKFLHRCALQFEDYAMIGLPNIFLHRAQKYIKPAPLCTYKSYVFLFIVNTAH